MEAIAGIALASNILQFVQLGLSVVSKGHAFKRSSDGALKKHKDLNVIVDDLDKVLLQLEVDTDDGLAPLRERCKLVGGELKAMLRKTVAGSTKGQLFSSYRKAIVAVWNEREVRELQERLEGLREEMGVRLQMLMRYSEADFAWTKLTDDRQDVGKTLETSAIVHESIEQGRHDINNLVS